MNDRRPASFLQRLLSTKPVELDPADVGTAFGLDLSVSPEESDAEHPVDRREPGWLQRLGLI